MAKKGEGHKMATNEELIEQYRQKRGKILQMGGTAAVERQHKEGKWTARERLDYFFDPGTFTEIGLFVKNRTTAFGLDKREIPAEGVVTGFGKVNNRYVVVAAEETAAGTAIADLVRSAAEHFDSAMAAQRAGDWARYGEEMRQVGQLLQQLQERAEGGAGGGLR